MTFQALTVVIFMGSRTAKEHINMDIQILHNTSVLDSETVSKVLNVTRFACFGVSVCVFAFVFNFQRFLFQSK